MIIEMQFVLALYDHVADLLTRLWLIPATLIFDDGNAINGQALNSHLRLLEETVEQELVGLRLHSAFSLRGQLDGLDQLVSTLEVIDRNGRLAGSTKTDFVECIAFKFKADALICRAVAAEDPAAQVRNLGLAALPVLPL